jgi:putative AdoMet-dependent methyltransferase
MVDDGAMNGRRMTGATQWAGSGAGETLVTGSKRETRLGTGKTEREQLFDSWAKHYDSAVGSAASGFPFDGYEQVLDAAVESADAGPGLRVLDLGIGTGNLAARFVRQGCDVWGLDFSAEMLARAQAKWPEIHLIQASLQASLLDEWPTELPHPFDRIVSAYVLHEFDLATKIQMLWRAATQGLTPEGLIVVADIAFPTADARTKASRRWVDKWDPDEHYWAADEAIAACAQAGLEATYRQVSTCGGVFTVRRRGTGHLLPVLAAAGETEQREGEEAGAC